MNKKPTYEELEQRVKELEKTLLKCNPAEEALIESEKLFRLIVENVTDIIWIADMEMKFTYFSPSVTQMRGYSVEEAMAQSVEEAMTPASFESAMKVIAEELELHNKRERDPTRSRKLEAEITCKDGSTVWTEIESNFVYNSEGQPIGILGITRNITERKKSEKERKHAEEALRDSNEKLAALFQSSPMAIITLDPDGNVTFWNPAAEKIFGWKEKEVTGRFLPYVSEGKKSEHHALRNRVLSGEGFHNVEALRQKKDGSDIYISISTVPLKDSTGSISGIMSVIVDITERKQTEEALLESEEKYRSLFNSSRDAIMTLAPPTWLFTSGNPATVELFKGRDEAEFISLGPWQLSPERQPDGKPSAEKAKEMIETAMRNGSHFFEWTHCHSDGTPFPAEVLLTRMEQRGQVLLQATVRNITERKQVEEQRNKLIAELQKALSEVKTLRGFLPICSHCKKIRDDKGYWNQIESYIQDHSEAEFSHGICQECAKKYYPDMDIYDDNGEITED